MASFPGLTASVRSYQAGLLLIFVQLPPPSSVRRIPPIVFPDPCKKAYTRLLVAAEQASWIRCQVVPPGGGVTSVQVVLFPTVAPAGDLKIFPCAVPVLASITEA